VTCKTRRVAYPQFVVALLLFALQLVMGPHRLQPLLHGRQAIVDVLPFSTARAMHANLLVLWFLLGFMGATYYAIPYLERVQGSPRPAAASCRAKASLRASCGVEASRRGIRSPSCPSRRGGGQESRRRSEGACPSRLTHAKPVGWSGRSRAALRRSASPPPSRAASMSGT